MSPSPKDSSVRRLGGQTKVIPADSFHRLGALHQLTLEAFLSDSRDELIFRVLNRSRVLVGHDRAVLWGLEGSRPALLGVSGTATVVEHAPLIEEWRDLVRDLRQPATRQVLAVDAFATAGAAWTRHAERYEGLQVLWLPLAVKDRLIGGLWLERWNGPAFDESDLKLGQSLMLGYAAAWTKHRPLLRLRDWLFGAWRRPVILAAALAFAAVLIFGRARLRVAARCEVVPVEPEVVTAPLQATIERVLVRSGDPVQAPRAGEPGTVLFRYDSRDIRGDLETAKERLRLRRTMLREAQKQGLDDPAERARIRELAHALARERIDYELAAYTAARLVVRARTDGVALVDQPEAWTGRPVEVGQQVLRVVRPDRTRLRIWIPEADNIEFDRNVPGVAVLNASTERSRTIALRFVEIHALPDDKGVQSFEAEADWVDPEADVQLGQQGTAFLYGDSVPLGYWLLRKPLATIRQFLGL